MSGDGVRSIGFAPVVSDKTRLLVLGSLPGIASLNAAQYYAHPRNAFWPIAAALAGEPLDALPYEDRLQVLLQSGIGLWDVLASAERSGSLDSAIRSPEAADLITLVRTLPRLEAIGFNGKAAAKIGRKILEGHIGPIPLIDLPSTSPAYTMPFETKLALWRQRLPAF
ncbi:DNA-deoxyinosine glycosylase [Brevundimonas sp.]|uniref:DNA-deoxyinosine glycosylase n=1 Tax=Brevundimonas sp. TaxID=1871086 RepID=UPI0028A050BE|nr:DNA-deoxyinosine glycosylase [Brevundimonas sp.]